MKKVLKNISKISLILIVSLIFIDFVGAESYNNFRGPLRSCGNGLITDIPSPLTEAFMVIYNVIQVAVPIVLVIMGSIDLTKSMAAGKEEEIAKGRQLFIKRLIAASLVFFSFLIVKFVIGLVAADENSANRIIDCANCFIRNDCDG